MRSTRCAVAAVIGGLVVFVASMVFAEVGDTMASVVHGDRVDSRISEDGRVRAVPMAQGEWAYLGEFTLDPGVEREPDVRDDEEYLYVLSGSAILNVDGTSFLVGPRMAVYLPAGSHIHWKNGPDQLVAVQFFAGPSPGPGYQDWSVEDDEEQWPRPRIRPRPAPSRVSSK